MNMPPSQSMRAPPDRERLKSLGRIRNYIFFGQIFVSVISASFTLRELTSPSRTDNLHVFSAATCQTLFAISWVLFALTIWIAAFSALFLAVIHEDGTESWKGTVELMITGWKLNTSQFEMTANILCAFTTILLLLAWIICCIALIGYSPVPGVIGLFFLGAILLVLLTVFTMLLLRRRKLGDIFQQSENERFSGAISGLPMDADDEVVEHHHFGGNEPPAPIYPIQVPMITTTFEATTSDAQPHENTPSHMTSFTASHMNPRTAPPPPVPGSAMGSVGSRPSTRRHQPIVIEDPRYKVHDYVTEVPGGQPTM